MTKVIHQKILPFIFILLFSGLASAALPNITGTYQALSVKYVGINLPACQATNVVLVVSSQCGNVFRGTLKVGADAAIPVTGRLSQFGTTVNLSLSGRNVTTGIPTGSIYSATYNTTTKAISVSGDSFFYTSTTFNVINLEMQDFVLNKQ